ncbi:DNA polymerase subunit Cdc27 [Nemania sp. NC0429]|nr:DNA polymerase subunit Cdc27 [Nemania sp. NC0429]
MEDYKHYLAQKILTEDQVVTYRLLSRALKVHVNTAKEMLYDFHKWQNDKRPNSLHATYIIYGSKNREVHKRSGHDDGDGDGDGDGDVDMTNTQTSEDVDDMNAPFSDLVPTYTISLARQEQLEETLSQYSEVTSIHVYSLASHPLKDLQLLTDSARQVFQLSTTDNTPNSSKVYGTISNPNVRRRERRAGPVPKAYAPKVESKPPVKQEVNRVEAVAVKQEPKESSKPAASAAPAKKPTPAPAVKRQASSGIGQMFAKAAAKPKKPVAKASEPPTSAAAGGAKDNPATGTMSDDGEDDAETVVKVKQEDSTARQARKDRQAELHRMMEDSDEEEPEEAAESQEEGDPMEEDLPPPEPEPEPEPKAEEQAEVVSSTSGGRRKGRRRVTRKKQIMDEKGYLVTIQEQGWESFSEDEAPPPPPKPKQPQAVKAEPPAKPKKGAAGKGAQGNIMSFFSKK